MKKHLLALAIGFAMLATGLYRMKQSGDEVFKVQQWSLIIAGALVMALAALASKRPRNAGFGVILAAMAVVMSGAMALPFQESFDAMPSVILGLAGMAAGIYCMTGTRAGDR